MRDDASIALLVAVIALLVFAAICLIYGFVFARTREMVRRVARADALLSEECMVRFGYRECPGLAQITGETLHVDTAFFNIHLALPLGGLTVSRIVGGAWRYTGSQGWIGKYRLHLSAPGLNRPLIIGVKRIDDWRRSLPSSHTALTG